MNVDESEREPESIIQEFISIHNLQLISQDTKQNLTTYQLKSGQFSHEIRLDVKKFYIAFYTYMPSTSIPFSTKRDQSLFYVAHINELLTVTSLDVNIQTGEYKLKSSQGFPKGMNFLRVLTYFLQRQLFEFPSLKSNIEEFCLSSSEPYHLAKKFHSELNSNKP